MDEYHLIILTILAICAPAVLIGLVLIAREWSNADTFGKVLLGSIAWLLLILGFWLTQFPGSPLGIVKVAA